MEIQIQLEFVYFQVDRGLICIYMVSFFHIMIII